MYEVAVKWPTNPQWRNQWSFLLTNFGVECLYEIGKPDDVEPIIKDSIAVPTVAELPKQPIILAAPENGFYMKAEHDLRSFDHPNDCVYLFWADNLQLSLSDLCDRQVTSVFVPTSTHHDMYSWVAGAIILYDRLVKNG